MTLPEQRRRQIPDDETGEAQRFDTSRSAATSALRNNRLQQDTRLQEDRWVTSFVGRLEALIRDVGGSREK
jgi:hypothetical protein